MTRENAQERARAECLRRGWPWIEPVHVQRRLLSWHFVTNAEYLGGNVSITIDIRTGAVKSAVFYRR